VKQLKQIEKKKIYMQLDCSSFKARAKLRHILIYFGVTPPDCIQQNGCLVDVTEIKGKAVSIFWSAIILLYSVKAIGHGVFSIEGKDEKNIRHKAKRVI